MSGLPYSSTHRRSSDTATKPRKDHRAAPETFGSVGAEGLEPPTFAL